MASNRVFQFKEPSYGVYDCKLGKLVAIFVAEIYAREFARLYQDDCKNDTEIFNVDEFVCIEEIQEETGISTNATTKTDRMIRVPQAMLQQGSHRYGCTALEKFESGELASPWNYGNHTMLNASAKIKGHIPWIKFNCADATCSTNLLLRQDHVLAMMQPHNGGQRKWK